MLEAKLWHNKTETKNAKVAKMVEFIKTFDQYPRRFNFLLLCLEVLGEGFLFSWETEKGFVGNYCL